MGIVRYFDAGKCSGAIIELADKIDAVPNLFLSKLAIAGTYIADATC